MSNYIKRIALCCCTAFAVGLFPIASAAAVADTKDIPIGVYRGSIAFSAVNTYENWIGRPMDYMLDFLAFAQSTDNWSHISNPNWWTDAYKNSVYQKRLMLSVPMMPANVGATLAIGATGAYDQYFVSLANNLVNRGLENAMLRIGWEMNGDWYAWAARGKEADFVKYFQNIVTAMRSVEGQCFKFIWNPCTGENVNLELIYPGDDYVDIIALDIYDQSWSRDTYDLTLEYNSDDGAVNNIDRFDEAEKKRRRDKVWNFKRYGNWGLDWFSYFAKLHNKPLGIAEWGVIDRPRTVDGKKINNGGMDNPEFIQRMTDWILENDIVFSLYFEYNPSPDFSVLSSNTKFPLSAAKFLELWGGDTKNIVSIEDISEIYVNKGTAFEALNLPTTVTGTLNDNTTEEIPVIWEKGVYNGDISEGVYEVCGKLDTTHATISGLRPSVIVNVTDMRYDFSSPTDAQAFEIPNGWTTTNEMITSIGNGSALVGTAEMSDYSIEADVNITSITNNTSCYVGLVAGYTSDSSRYLFTYGADGSQKTRLRILRKHPSGDKETVKAFSNEGLKSGPQKLKAVMRNGVLEFWLNGKKEMTVEDDTITSGKAGVIYFNGKGTLDNVIIQRGPTVNAELPESSIPQLPQRDIKPVPMPATETEPELFCDFSNGYAADFQVDSGAWRVDPITGAYTQMIGSFYSDTWQSGIASAGLASWKDYSIEADVTLLGLTDYTHQQSMFQLGFMTRYSDINNRYSSMYVDDLPGLGSNGPRYGLIRKMSGVDKAVSPTATKQTKWDVGVTKRLKTVVSGNKLEFWVDGKKVISGTDNDISAGKVALYTFNCTASFDNITIRSNAPVNTGMLRCMNSEGVQITSAAQLTPGEDVTIQGSLFKNDTAVSNRVFCYAAIFSSEGNVLDAGIATVDFIDNIGEVNIPLTAPENTQCYIKAFTWNDSLQPLAQQRSTVRIFKDKP